MNETLRVAPGCRVKVLTTTSNSVVLEGQSQNVAWPAWASLGVLANAVPFLGDAAEGLTAMSGEGEREGDGECQ